MELLYLLISAAAIAYVATPWVIKLAKNLDLVTDKRKRAHPAHTHEGIIPRAGGIPVLLGILIPVFVYVQVNKIVIGILIASTLIVLLGLFDDKYDLSPYWRFVANIIISAIVVMFGLGIPFISNPFGGAIRLDTVRVSFSLFGSTHSILVVADLLAIIWLTWIMNMVNWSKGVDGQLPGFVAIAALFLGLLSQRFVSHDISTQTVMFFSFIVAGAHIGFLPFNYFPQKIMPGYSGGALAGFLLGVLSILSFGKVGTAVLILAVPMIDATYTIMRRIKQKKSPFRADWGHFHHRLLEIGWGKRRIAIFYWLVSLILGVASLLLNGVEKLIAFVVIGILLLVFIFLIEEIKERT
ncbi:undecaprenyl/decaprenyl-phosphate alpha-N-acetylglucosaminyl 1-phosphate transferase [Candidatus Woesebacteria bacterium]|nr:undecaprenyl/decaprenyl-phosphate alpha-N-acetylglucosaminyl 1-phosphate transferase [Candidatus Woesebacteria bacterium]